MTKTHEKTMRYKKVEKYFFVSENVPYSED